MNPERVRNRQMGFDLQLAGQLAGFELVFNKRSRKYAGAASANVMKADAGSVVEGVVYRLTDADQITVMDVFEGYPELYNRILLPVQTQQGALQAWTYLANPQHVMTGLKPASWYLAHLLAGQPFLTAAYYERLQQVACLPNSEQEPE